MADIFDDVFNLRPRSKKRKSTIPDLSPVEEQSVLESLGSNALSGLGFVGNVLDTPGSLVRNTLAGEDPFKGFFNPEERTSGRDVLEQYGILDKNQAGIDAGDVGGFAAEVLLDPLTWMTLGGAALAKGGKALKAAGKMDDVVRVASKKAGREVGKREARITTTAADMFGGNAQQAAAELGIDIADATKPLGGMVGFNAPFRDPFAVMGTGPLAQKVARGVDKVGEAFRFGNIPGTNYSPGRHAFELFDSSVQGTKTTSGQKAAKGFTRELEEGVANVDLDAQLSATTLNKAGLGDAAGGADVRHTIENPAQAAAARSASVPMMITQAMRKKLRDLGVSDDVVANMTPQQAHDYINSAVDSAVDPMKKYTQEAVTRKVAEGLDPKILQDPAGIDYFPRRMTKGFKQHTGDASAQAFKVTDGSDISRLEEWKGIKQGTKRLSEIVSDPNIAQIKQAINTGQMKPDMLGQYIKAKYAADFVDPDTIIPFAEHLKGVPDDLLATGVFGNHPTVDFQTYGHGVERSVASARAAKEVIGKHAQTVQGSFDPTTHIRVGDVMEKLGFDMKNFPQYQSSQVASVVMPLAEAGDLLKMRDGFKSPEAVGKLLSAFDSYVNLWKAGVLTRPARYVRDIGSGNIEAANEGVLSMRGWKAFNKLITGGDIPDAHMIPEVAKVLAKKGLPKERANDVLRSIIAANGMAGNKQAQGSVVGNLANTATGGVEDLLGSQPGHRPVSVGEFFTTLRGKAPGAKWHPKNVRGYRGRTTSDFPIVAAGEYAGHYTDSANRVPGFIEMLYQGVDSKEAARRINAAQVDYSAKAYTPFEREVMSRVFPFYKFVKSKGPHVVKNLAERPGGSVAQEIRAANQANKDREPLPDKVTAGMAIPLGEQEDGTKRFLTSLGLMHEDPLTLLQIGDSKLDTLSKTGRQLLGRVNPVIKTLAEIPMGKLAFSGQDLREADPSIGRTMSSIKDLITGEKSIDAMGSGSDDATLAEYAATLIPGVSAISNTARTAVDQRKSVGDKATNLLTGVKITDISPKTQEAVVIERVKDKLKKSGGKVMERAYIPKYRRETAKDGELDRADSLLGLLRAQDKRRQAANKKPKKRKPEKSVFGF